MSPSAAHGAGRAERILAACGIALLGLSAGMLSRREIPGRAELLAASGCQVPVQIFTPPDGSTALTINGKASGSAVVFHGLSANRRFMFALAKRLAGTGLRVFVVDFPGHGDNAEPFSYARAEQCAAAVMDALEQRREITPERTVLVGHSMGAGIAIRLADRFPAAATLAISTALLMPSQEKPARMVPLEFPRRMPSNLLLLNGQLDLERAKDVSRRLLRAAGGERSDAEDFGQRRAVRWVVVPRATHTSLVFDPRVWDELERWSRSALGANRFSAHAAGSNSVLWALTGLLGLLLIFPAVASAATGALGTKVAEPEGRGPRRSAAIAAWALVAMVAAGGQYAFVPLAALRMLTGAYLASFLLIAGVLLLALFRKEAGAALRLDSAATAAAALLALLALAGIGVWLNWQLTDAWMNPARAWRFALLTILLLPYCLAEEAALGPVKRRPLARFGLFLLLRLLLWLAMVAAIFVLGSGEILILLLGAYLAAFSVAQRLGADAIRRRTGSASAAAVFGAILGAWFIAAVFPLTG